MNFVHLYGLISIQWTKFVTTLMCLMSYMTVDMWEEGSKRSSQRSWKTSYLASGAKGKLEREREHYWTLMRQQQIQQLSSENFPNESSQCLKITEKVSFNIASEASYVYILSGQKLIKNGPFWRVFENLKLAVKQCYQTGQF